MRADTRGRKTECGDQCAPAAKGGRWPQFRSNPRRLPLTVLGLLCSVFCFSPGCGPSEQAQAYARAEQAEQRFTVESAQATITEYRRVIALDPKSDWARKATARIHALETRLRAEETRKDVFQEHGVD